MIEIDGEEGGGQLLRSALTCSIAQGRGFTLRNVRGARDNPGLKPQHLAAVELAANLSDATVTGASVDSMEVSFEPDRIQSRSISVDIGTAGSITLLIDTVLPLVTVIDQPIRVTVTGGTDVKWAPLVDYHRFVKLPLLRGFGFFASIEIVRRGFYPKGGGKVTCVLIPSDAEPLDVNDRGTLESLSVHSVASEDLRDREVAERQLGACRERLESTDQSITTEVSTYTETASPGTGIVVAAHFEHSWAGASALGERGKPAEKVGSEAADSFIDFLSGQSPVDRYLGDQLLVPLALAGGEIQVPSVTSHIVTNASMLRQFGYEISILREGRTSRIIASE